LCLVGARFVWEQRIDPHRYAELDAIEYDALLSVADDPFIVHSACLSDGEDQAGAVIHRPTHALATLYLVEQSAPTVDVTAADQGAPAVDG
jgi:hypothetical protein